MGATSSSLLAPQDREAAADPNASSGATITVQQQKQIFNGIHWPGFYRTRVNQAQRFYLWAEIGQIVPGSIKSLSDVAAPNVSEGTARTGVTGEGRVKQINLKEGRVPLTSAVLSDVAKGNTLSHNYY